LHGSQQLTHLTFSFFSEKYIHTSVLFPCRKSGNVPLKKTRAKAVGRLTAWDTSTTARFPR
jgi:hypothetical protein